MQSGFPSALAVPGRRLLHRGDTVVGIDNRNDYYDVRLKHARLACLAGQGDFRFIERARADRAAMAALFAGEGFERVIHPHRLACAVRCSNPTPASTAIWSAS